MLVFNTLQIPVLERQFVVILKLLARGIFTRVHVAIRERTRGKLIFGLNMEKKYRGISTRLLRALIRVRK